MKPAVRLLLWCGGAVVLLVNVVALAGVAWNRGGEPEAVLTLGERELRLPPAWRYDREDSGLALSLHWRVAPDLQEHEGRFAYEPGAYTPVEWLDAERLAALGFDVSHEADERRSFRPQRGAWLALELDGPAHARSVQQAREALARAEQAVAETPDDEERRKRATEARQRFEQVRDAWSRLVAIDADLDAETLRARHPDRQRVAIVRGRVRPYWRFGDPLTRADGEWYGQVEAVAVDRVHVPRALRGVFDPLRATATSRQPDRYEATVAWGRRMEPWIEEVRTNAR
jgi:hypothetical protein